MDSGGPTDHTDSGAADQASAALAPPPLLRGTSCERSPEENDFLQCVDAALAADKRLSKVSSESGTSESGRWRVERTLSCDSEKQGALSFRLSRKSGKKWIVVYKEVQGQDVQDHARKLLVRRHRGRVKANTEEDQDEDDDAEAADHLLARGAKEYSEAKPGKDLHDEDDEDGDLDVFRREVLDANRDRELELPDGFAPQGFDWQQKEGMRPGEIGFSAYVREQMVRHGVPSTKEVTAPADKPLLQPYQQTASFIAHPSTCAAFASPESPIPGVAPGYPRLLVAHCTGSGKTCTMIRIADNFFKDKRPKILLFPTAVLK